MSSWGTSWGSGWGNSWGAVASGDANAPGDTIVVTCAVALSGAATGSGPTVADPGGVPLWWWLTRGRAGFAPGDVLECRISILGGSATGSARQRGRTVSLRASFAVAPGPVAVGVRNFSDEELILIAEAA